MNEVGASPRYQNDAPLIVKADGSTEAFVLDRLIQSLIRAGAGPHTAERIATQIESSVAPGSASKEIYSRAFALLRKEGRPIAARYALRRALFEFGPSGHPFEDFVSHLFRADGWNVETRKIMQGKCVAHEVDFYATKGKEYLAAELKYHNDPAYKTDVKVALYVKARFEDIWRYLTLKDVVEAFPKLRLPSGEKKYWRRALNTWGYHV